MKLKEDAAAREARVKARAANEAQKAQDAMDAKAAKQAREDAKKSKSSIFNFFGKPKEKAENDALENSVVNESSMELQEGIDENKLVHLSPTKAVASDTAKGWDPEDRIFLDP